MPNGTPGADQFTAPIGSSTFNGFGGTDTITFDFKLTDATFTWIDNQLIVDTPTSHTVLTGFEVFQFKDGTVHTDDGSPLVDDLYYYVNHPDVWSAHADADAHYNLIGWHDNRNPNAFFNTKLYLSIYHDVASSDLSPIQQYDLTGWQQNRLFSLDFDARQYLLSNPDIAAAHVDPLAHFLAFGAAEGRQPVAPLTYPALNGFDYVYYLQHNPDVLAAGVDPFQHFQTFGWREGRNPNAFFDTAGYLATYADVAAAGVNPLDHFHHFGWAEGRISSPLFDPQQYLAHYADVAAAHVDPLVHYLIFGLHEGRTAFAIPIIDSDGAANGVVEGAANGTHVGVTVAWGGWKSPSLFYTLSGDSSGGGFAIDPATGVITILDGSKIDFEATLAHSYTVTVTAHDAGLTSSQDFTIAVADAAPALPPSAPQIGIVDELAPNGSTVGINFSVTDPNGPAATYTLTDDANGRFAIDPNTGEVTVANGAAIDYETTPGHVYTITAKGTVGGLSTSQTFTINVSNVNEVPSGVVFANAVTAIDENTVVGTGIKVADVTVADDTLGSAALSLSGADAGSFELRGGSLYFIGPSPDFEAKASYSVTVEANDPAVGGPVDASASFRLNVTDVNEAPTVVSFANMVTAIDENAVVGTGIKVADVVVTDDALGSATLRLSGADSGSFELRGSELYFIGASPDFEKKSSYAVTVEADDPTVGGAIDAQATFALDITDVNEAPTAVSFANAVTEIDENTVVGTGIKVADVTVADDALGGAALSLSGADAGSFELRGGSLYFIGASPDFEAKSSYAVTVEADDPSVGGSVDAQATFTLAINDVNEAPTAVSFANTVTAVDENSVVSSGIKVADVVVTDDALGSATLTLSGADSTLFELRGSELYFIGASPDFETKASYAVTVEADDPAVGGAIDAQATFALNVTDVNEAPTAVSFANTVTVIDENTVVGTGIKVADVVVTDDALGSATLTLSGADAASFQLRGSELYFIGASPDFEAKASYAVTVEADDPAVGGAIDAQATFTLDINDVNEAPTTVLFANTVTAIDENTVVGTGIKVADVAVTDDALGSETLTLSGTDSALFELRGSELYFIGASPDFEAKASYAVTVEADDPAVGGAIDAQATFTLDVTDLNEAPTAVSFANAVTEIDENVTVGSGIKVADVVVADDALGSGTLSLSGADSAFFELRGNELYFVGASPDFEAKASYAVTVEADDPTVGGPIDAQATFTLDVTDVNEAPTAVSFANPVTAVDENTTLGTGIKVADVVVTDDALGSATLSLSGADSALFELRGSALYFIGASPDFEAKASYAVTVEADDPTVGGAIDAQATFTLNVTDVNEAPTAVSFANTVTAVDENVTVGSGIKVADVVVTDDALGSETLTLSGADSAFFELRGSELYFIGASPDFETKASYAVTVEADDPAVGGAIDAQATFTFSINDQAENALPVTTGATNGTVRRDVSFQIPPDAITNGSFEQGLNNSPLDLPGWTFAGTAFLLASDPHSGSDALYFLFSPGSTATQTVWTVEGVHYKLDFWLRNFDIQARPNDFTISWNGTVVDTYTNVPGAFAAPWVKHSYELVGTGGPMTLTFSGSNPNGWVLDDVSLTPVGITVTPGTETTSGMNTFTDADTADTHTVLSVTPLGMNYVGTFNAILDPAEDSTGGQTGTVRWTFNVSDAALAFLTAQQSVDQVYRVTIDDGHGGQASRDVTVTLTNPDHVPVVTASTNGSVARDDQADPVSANLVGNPGFENDFDPWSFPNGGQLNNSPTQAHSGGWYYLATTTGGAPNIVTQSFATTPGVTYLIDFWLANDHGNGPNSATVSWDGATVVSLVNLPGASDGFGSTTYTHYTYQVVATDTSSTLTFSFVNHFTDGFFLFDDVSVSTVPDAESTYGTISFTDVDTIDIHTVSAQANGVNYVGTFTATLAPADDATGGHPGTVYWTFTAPDAALTSIAAQQSTVQTYTVTIADNHGGSTTRDVAVTLTNPDHAPVFTSALSGASVFANRSFAVPAGNMVQNGGFEDSSRDLDARTTIYPGWTGAGFLYLPQGSDVAHSGSDAVGFAAFFNPGTWSQSVPTVADVHYTLSFWAAAAFSSNNSIAVNWNGQTVFARANVPAIPTTSPSGPGDYTQYTVDVVGRAGSSDLTFSLRTQYYWYLDDVSITAVGVTPGTETTQGSLHFTDVDAADAHTVSVAPNGNIGTFSASLGGPGTVNWSYSVADSALSFLAAQQSVDQVFTVIVDDGHGGTATQNVTVTLTNPDHAPLAHDDIFPSATAAFNTSIDLFVGVNGAASHAWLNNGQGAFQVQPQNYQGAGGADTVNDVTLADIDKDGNLDVIMALNNQGLAIFRNTGAGVFNLVQTIATSTTPADSTVQAGDLNGDGFVDLVTSGMGAAGYNAPNRVLLNNGNGTFAVAQTIGTSSSRSGVALGDFDENGKLDVFVANGINGNTGPANPSVWLNDGAGHFAAAAAGGADPQSIAGYSVALADFDHDGHLDAFVGRESGGDQVWFGDGHGGFTLHQTVGASLTRSLSVAVGDLNGDGFADVITASYDDLSPDPVFTTPEIYLNDQHGNLVAAGGILNNMQGTDVALADVNGDGALDLILDTTSGKAFVFHNDGHAHFTLRSQLATGASAALAAGNLDANIQPQPILANAPRTLAVLANDTDADGDALSVSAVGTSGIGASLSIAPDQRGVIYDASNSAVAKALAAGVTLVDTFTYTVSDGHGGTATANVTVTVTGVNDAPTLANTLADQSGAPGTAFLFQFAANTFNDIDPGDTLTYSATLQDGSALPAWLQFDGATRTFSGVPGPADETIDVKVTATDSGNASVSDTFTLTLPPHNHAPVLTNAASVGEVLTKTQAIASLSTALVLDGHLGFGADPNIANATAIPHVSIAAAGSGTLDYYRFTVTAGSRGIFDIDSGGLDTLINLLDSNGTLVEWSDDSLVSDGAGGSTQSGGFGSTLDSFLDYTFASGGTYYLAVGLYNNGNTTPANIPSGQAYQLQVSLTGGITAPARLTLGDAGMNAPAPSGPVGTLVSSLVDFPGNGGHDNVSDIDPGAVTGIALTHASAHGSWWFSLDNGATWNSVGAVDDAHALLLPSDARLYFQPDAGFSGAISDAITFRAWDQASGVAGDKVDASTNGGITPFSAATQPADINVVNHAPVFLPQFENFADQFASQSYGLSSGGVNWPGSWSETGESTSPTAGEIQVVMDGVPGNFSLRFSDADGSNDSIQRTVNLTGATAILSFDYRRQGLDDANDEIRIAVSTDGTNFSDIAVIEGPTNDGVYQSFSIDISSFVSATTTIRFLAPGALGSNDFVFVDNVRVAYSLPYALGSVDEDSGAPGRAVGTLVSGLVDLPGNGGRDNVTDADGAAVTGIAVTGVNSGTLWYSLDDGATWTAAAVSATHSLLLAADPGVRVYFRPNADFSGTLANAITFRAWDQSSGTHGGFADTTINGGTTAFSSAAGNGGITVNGINDAPTDIIWNQVAPASGAALPAAGATLANLATVDSDDTSFTYSLLAGSSGGFAVSAAGVVTATAALAANTTYTLIVESRDPASLAVSKTFTIVTGDGTDNAALPPGGAGDPILAGDNIVYGSAGADVVYGGAGRDVLFGQDGDDIIRAGAGSDAIDGGAGIDLLDYSDQGQTSNGTGIDGVNIDGFAQSSSLNVINQGPDAVDSYFNMEGVIGSAFNDRIVGSSAGDILRGGGGDDQLSGAGGNDTIRGGSGNDTIDGGSGSGDLLDLSDASGPVTFTLVQSASGTALDLTSVGLGLDSYLNMEGVIGSDFNDTLTGSSGADTLRGGLGDDQLTGGAGADNLTGGGGIDSFLYAGGSTAITIGGSAQNGTIAGYDVITDFVAATDFLDLVGVPVAAANTTGTNGVDSALRLTSTSSTTIKSHAISNGIISFSTSDTFGSPQTLTSTANVAAVVQYLERNDLGNAGVTVAFTATISSVAHTFVYQQVGDTPNAANDILVDLSGVTIANLSTLISNGHIDPIVLDLGARGISLAPIERGVQFDMDGDGIRDRMAWTAGEDGILAFDLDRSGTIQNGKEILSPWFAGGNFADSLAALATLDGNHDRRIDAHDADFGKLLVWQDLNHDGVSDPGELYGLADLGITGIALDATPLDGYADGQALLAQGTFSKADGSTGDFVEVAFDWRAAHHHDFMV